MGDAILSISTSIRARSALNWLLVGFLIALEFFLFRHFLIREVIWAYPPNNDQLGYLQQTYELYERARIDGLWSAIANQPPMPQGALMQSQAAILFRLFGASRFNALLLNFLYFALFQVVLIWTVRWLCGCWSVAWTALGLLLTALTPFCGAGGIYDFRMDFIAFCLYGSFMCLVIRSGVFTNKRWSIVAGMGGAWLICFRFVAAAYVGGVFTIVFAVAAIAWLRRGTKPTDNLRARQLSGLLICAGVIAVITGPILWTRRQAIHDYYVVGHVTGAEKNVRAASMGTTEFWNAIKFYPDSLLWHHAGPMFLTLSAGIIALAGLLRRMSRATSSRAQSQRSDFPFGPAYLFTAACLLVPMMILTSDVSKSPVVADVMVAPLVWLVVLGFTQLSRCSVTAIKFSPHPTLSGSAGSGEERPNAVAPVLVLIAAATICLGIRNQYKAYDADRFMSRHRGDVENLDRMYDLIAEHSGAAKLQSVAIFNERLSDDLDAEVCRLLTYERHGYFLNVGNQFSTLVEVPQSEIFKRLSECNFAIISHRLHRAARYDYPFNRETEQIDPQIHDVCRQTMQEIGHYAIFNEDVILYERTPRRRQ